jgi:hypothetical protein
MGTDGNGSSLFCGQRYRYAFSGLVKVRSLRGFGKNLHPSGSIFPKNLDNPCIAVLFARKREFP